MKKSVDELFRDPEQQKKDADFIRRMTDFMENHEFFFDDLGLICTDYETLETMVPGEMQKKEHPNGILYMKEWMDHTYYCNWF